MSSTHDNTGKPPDPAMARLVDILSTAVANAATRTARILGAPMERLYLTLSVAIAAPEGSDEGLPIVAAIRVPTDANGDPSMDAGIVALMITCLTDHMRRAEKEARDRRAAGLNWP